MDHFIFAIDKKDNQPMIGYVNPDPKSKMIKLNNRSFRKENLDYLYKKGGTICDVLSLLKILDLPGFIQDQLM